MTVGVGATLQERVPRPLRTFLFPIIASFQLLGALFCTIGWFFEPNSAILLVCLAAILPFVLASSAMWFGDFFLALGDPQSVNRLSPQSLRSVRRYALVAAVFALGSYFFAMLFGLYGPDFSQHETLQAMAKWSALGVSAGECVWCWVCFHRSLFLRVGRLARSSRKAIEIVETKQTGSEPG